METIDADLFRRAMAVSKWLANFINKQDELAKLQLINLHPILIDSFYPEFPKKPKDK
jgi:hypothetical protein